MRIIKMNMKIKGIILILVLLFISSVVYSKSTFIITITRISDGDSFNALYEEFPIGVRLYGIDSPEIKQKYGLDSKKALESLINIGDKVEIEVVNFDSYRRAVSIIKITDIIIQEELLKSGNAWVYPQYCKLSICDKWKSIQEDARLNKIGLWADEEPIAPWEFRKQK